MLKKIFSFISNIIQFTIIILFLGLFILSMVVEVYYINLDKMLVEAREEGLLETINKQLDDIKKDNLIEYQQNQQEIRLLHMGDVVVQPKHAPKYFGDKIELVTYYEIEDVPWQELLILSRIATYINAEWDIKSDSGLDDKFVTFLIEKGHYQLLSSEYKRIQIHRNQYEWIQSNGGNYKLTISFEENAPKFNKEKKWYFEKVVRKIGIPAIFKDCSTELQNGLFSFNIRWFDGPLFWKVACLEPENLSEVLCN